MDNFFDNITETIKRKHRLVRILTMFLSLLISAIVFNLFLLPSGLIAGGANGIATILNKQFGFNPSIVLLVILLICTALAFIFLGKERALGSIAAVIIYPLLVQIISLFTRYIELDISDMFLITIFAGVLTGIANGLMYKTGYSNGGLQVISHILYEHFKIPIAKSNIVINGLIVISGGVFFGWTMVMYAIILLYISSIIIDKVLLGISNNKAFYIVTSEEEKIKDYIMNEMHHSITIFDVKGAFLEKKRRVLLTVIPTREYFKVTEGVKLIDKNAFFIATDAYQVEGAK